MPDRVLTFVDPPTQTNIPQRAFDIGSGQFALAVGNIGCDTTNGVQKIAEKWIPGTITGAADGATITGLGVLRKLILSNNNVAATTATIYDNTVGSGTKLLPTIALPANTTVQIDVAVPFTIGVFIDWATPTGCDGQGFYQAVN